jgi:hypothetical protein
MKSRSLLWLFLLLATEGRSADTASAPSLWSEERSVIGLSIALSEETADAPVSLFGHLFAIVRTADDSGKPWPVRLENGINVAVATNGPLDEATFRKIPVQRMLFEANTKERRNVVVVDIFLTPEELKILGHELNNRLNLTCRYDLLRRNCAFYILEWLAAVRPAMRSEVRWRPVWTPRHAMQVIEGHFEVSKRMIMPATALSDDSQDSVGRTPISTRQLDKDWASTEEGVRIAAVFSTSAAGESAGVALSLGHRDHGTLPLGEDSTNRLCILGITHLSGMPNSETRVTLLEFENLREISGEKPRLSQRLEVSWQDSQRVDALEGFVAQFETGAATRFSNTTWLAGMAGISLSESTDQVIRPLASLQILQIKSAGAMGLGYRTTGGDDAGVFASASLRLINKTYLNIELADSRKTGSRTEMSVSRRY